MLKIDFTEPSDIHYVEAERIGTFKGNGPFPGRRTISVDVTKIFERDSELVDKSLAVIDLFGAQVGRFLEVLSMRIFRRTVISTPSVQKFMYRLVHEHDKLMDELRANAVRQKTAKQRTAAAAAGVPVLGQGDRSKIKPILLPGLPPKLRKAALDRAAAILLRYWSLIQGKALDEIRSMPEWKTPESQSSAISSVAGNTVTSSPLQTAPSVSADTAPADGNSDSVKTDETDSAAQAGAAAASSASAPASQTSGKKKRSKKKPVTPFTAVERSYIREILDSPSERFFDVLDGKAPEPVRIESAGIKTRRKICKIIRAAVDSVKGRTPVHGDNRSVVYEESNYSPTYDVAKKETRLKFASLKSGSRMSITVPGELPVREMILPAGADKPVEVKNRLMPAIQLIHDVGYWGFDFPVPVRWRTHDVPTEKPDKNLFRMAGYQAVLTAGSLPNLDVIQSDWFDSNSYCVLFDEKRSVTRLTFLPDDPVNAFTLELPPKAKPAKEGVLLKNGQIISVQPKKPLVHLVRTGPTGGPMVEFRSPLKPGKKDKSHPNFYRAYPCHVLSHEGSSLCVPESNIGFEAFDGQSYTAVYEKDNDVTELNLRRRGGLPDKKIRLQGRLPVCEYLDDGKGGRTLCSRTKKPTVYCTETAKKLTVVLMLPAQLPDSIAAAFGLTKTQTPAETPTESKPSLCMKKVLASMIEGTYANRRSVSGYYMPEEYRAVYDKQKNETVVAAKPASPRQLGFSFSFKGRGGIIDCEINADGECIDRMPKVKPAFKLDRTQIDAATGDPVMTVTLVSHNPAVRLPGFCADASLDDAKKIRVTALDIGFTEFAYDNFGNRFGEKLGQVLIRYVNWITQIMKRRNRLYALTRGIFAPCEGVQSGSAAFQLLFDLFDNERAVNVRNNNLGTKGFNRRKKKFRAEIKRIINEAINDIFKFHAGNAIVLEDFGSRSFFDNSRLNKEWRRRLSTWVRGIIRERLEFKAALAGVRLIYVPSAYSSQVCPVCGNVDRANRHGDVFKCTCCGYEAHADAKAAEALLLRLHDPNICRRSQLRWIRHVHRKDHARWEEYYSDAAADDAAKAVVKEKTRKERSLQRLLNMVKDQSFACTRPAGSLKALYRVNQHSMLHTCVHQ